MSFVATTQCHSFGPHAVRAVHRPSLAGSAIAVTEVFVLAFDRVKLAATMQAIYEEVRPLPLPVSPARKRAAARSSLLPVIAGTTGCLIDWAACDEIPTDAASHTRASRS